jgi:hypothetical protein
VSGWDPGQVRAFAKQIAESAEGQAWPVLGPTLRDAIVSHHVLMVVLSQRGSSSIDIDDIRELRAMLHERLAAKHNLTLT